MSFLLTCKIIIGDYNFDFANEIEITSSWKELSDRCTLKLPNSAVLIKEQASGQSTRIQEEFSFEQRFRVGLPVEIHLGYDFDNKLEFQGYISKIKPNTPFEIECEDEMYQLKRQPTITSAYSGTLKGILQKYFSSSKISEKIPDMVLSNFIINKATPAQLLQSLKENYGLCAYFKNKVLYVGMPYVPFETLTPTKYHFQRNVILEKDNLTYRKADDVKIKVKAVSILRNNARVEAEVGDEEGETRTLHTYNEPDKSKLKAWAESQLPLLKYEGYTGSIEAFGVPFLRHSETVEFYDERYAERKKQVYFTDKIVTKWGMDGFHRTIDIGPKVV